MKKRSKHQKKFLQLLIIIIITISTLIAYKVKAGYQDSKLVKNYIGYRVNVTINGVLHLYNAIRYTMNDITVYCIDLGVDINDSIYNSTEDLTDIGLNEDQIKHIKLLSYYGYDYKEHKNNIYYYMAAQELIWEYLSNTPVTWVESLENPNNEINIETYKNEVLNLVNNHDLEPNLPNKISGIVGETITLEDTNNVLSNYQVEGITDNITIDNNQLIIKLNNNHLGNHTIKLVPKDEYSRNTILYYCNSSQRMISAGKLNKRPLELNLEAKGTDINVYKYDRDNNNTNSQGEATLEKAQYELYSEDNKLITSFTTDSNAHSYLDNIPLGTYHIKEIKASKGYLLNSEITTVTIDKPHNNLILYEDVIKSKIEILKLYGNKEDDQLQFENNITFNIYNNKNELYNTITTDEYGSASIELPYGNYTFSQQTNNNGFTKVADFNVTVSEDSEKIIRYNLFNKEIHPYLKIIKIDSESQKTIILSHTKFKIKNLTTNTYLTYHDKYNNKKIEVFETNDQGETIIPIELEYGKYKLEEVEAPNNYIPNNITFIIDKDSKFYYQNDYGYLVDIKFSNTPQKYNVKLNKQGDRFTVNKGEFFYEEIPLANVEFELYAKTNIVTGDGIVHYQKNDILKSVITDKEGNITINNLYPGEYCLREIKTLDKYELDSKPHCFNLNKDYKLNLINNLQSGKLVILKTDTSTGIPLKGATIEIYTNNSELIHTSITNDNGLIIVENLPLGSYYAVEKIAPNNYKLNSQKYFFTISEPNQTAELNITNDKIDKVENANTGDNAYKYIITLTISCIFSILIIRKISHLLKSKTNY